MLQEMNEANATATKVSNMFAKQPVRKKAHLFIDIETFDTVTTAAIWEVGALLVIEDEDGSLRDENSQYTLVPTISQQMTGNFSQSDETLKWLSQQSTDMAHRVTAARAATEMDAGDAVDTLIDKLVDQLERADITHSGDVFIYTWGQFDVPILNHYLRVFDKPLLETLSHYRNHIDLRSVVSYLGLNLRPDTSAHNAATDAQALYKTWCTMRDMNITLQPSLNV